MARGYPSPQSWPGATPVLAGRTSNGRGGGLSLGYPPEGTWDQRLGYPPEGTPQKGHGTRDWVPPERIWDHKVPPEGTCARD